LHATGVKSPTIRYAVPEAPAIGSRPCRRYTGVRESRISIEMHMSRPAPVPLFKRLLGAAFEGLPVPIKRVHDGSAPKRLSGRCRITRESGAVASVLAWAASLPRAGDDLPVEVSFQCDERSETWRRDFAGQPMRSTLRECDGLLEETLGPVRFRFVLRADDYAITWFVVGTRVLGLPLPAAWFRGVTAKESVEAGRYTFDVRAELPWIGLLVHYHGWLDCDEAGSVS
jgi:hypothetical protein